MQDLPKNQCIDSFKIYVSLCLYISYVAVLGTFLHPPTPHTKYYHARAGGSNGQGWAQPTQMCVLPTQSKVKKMCLAMSVALCPLSVKIEMSSAASTVNVAAPVDYNGRASVCVCVCVSAADISRCVCASAVVSVFHL